MPRQKPINFIENAAFLKELYAAYLEDPTRIDQKWRNYFTENYNKPALGSIETAQKTSQNLSNNLELSYKAWQLIEAYKRLGHLKAALDPLNLKKPREIPELKLEFYGLSARDLEREVCVFCPVDGRQALSLRALLDYLEETYCGVIGYDFGHLETPEEKEWIQRRIENRDPLKLEEKQDLLRYLILTEEFEKFLHTKFVGTKRFGLDGGESLIPALHQALLTSCHSGAQEVVLGMAHRGRLSVLAHLLGKPIYVLLAEFQGKFEEIEEGSGDVKYHLGFEAIRDLGEHQLRISLTANPSHLEAVDPVVLGKVRAKQQLREDKDRHQVMGILIHGDAAFIGQGVVAESFQLSGLEGYKTGGTLHFIINNQIGFTTPPEKARTSLTCAEVAKAVGAPIFHVNGDDPEAVLYVTKLAADFRSTFKKDAVIDLYCYRRFGHNEGDEPAFTQPLMYEKIHNHASVATLYGKGLIEQNVVDENQIKEISKDYLKAFKEAYDFSLTYEPGKLKYSEEIIKEFKEFQQGQEKATGVPLNNLEHCIEKLFQKPEGFSFNSKIARQFDQKQQLALKEDKVDWATAEALAFSTVLLENIPVRLSGQDVERGTFSQRHTVLYDQKTEVPYTPLNHLSSDQASFEAVNSPLSEMAVLGFDYGFSLSYPKALVLWEGQFGDFVNGAQVIIDQFIAAGEVKWLSASNLTLLLPHGMEGQGPEHSSARLERFLSLSAHYNWRVANCTTPANYFHILRRQVSGALKKPLILMTPKSLLRHKLALSSLKEMEAGTAFKPLLPDNLDPLQVKRVVLCSGKVYYDLLEARGERKDVALIRVEQLYPFPTTLLEKELLKYKTGELVWCQEEPRNMGAWTFVADIIREEMKKEIVYTGRGAASSPAAGSAKTHLIEQQVLIEEALREGK